MERLVPPYALIRRRPEAPAELELLRGRVASYERLADLPRVEDAEGGELLALVPYRQLRERGDDCHDDGTPLRALLVDSHTTIHLDELPVPPAALDTGVRDGAFDVADDAYARAVKEILDDEIGTGEGSNFVLRRTFVGHCGNAEATALAAFRNLLFQERNAYWTFLVHTGDAILVGATPERHVSLEAGVCTMNPISGTLRRPPASATREQVLAFLNDPKERDELAMVVDEELKMLAGSATAAASSTGRTSRRWRTSRTPSTTSGPTRRWMRARCCARRCSRRPRPARRSATRSASSGGTRARVGGITAVSRR